MVTIFTAAAAAPDSSAEVIFAPNVLCASADNAKEWQDMVVTVLETFVLLALLDAFIVAPARWVRQPHLTLLHAHP